MSLLQHETVPATPDIFADRQLLQIESVLCQSIAGTPPEKFDDLDFHFSENEYRTRRLFEGGGYALGLMEVCETMPGTPEAARARNLLLRCASGKVLGLYPQAVTFMAKHFLDGLGDTLRDLDTAPDESIDHEVVRYPLVIYTALMKELNEQGLWTADHTRGLFTVLREHPRLAHHISSWGEIVQTHLAHLGLPANVSGTAVRLAHFFTIDGARWAPETYNVWRAAELDAQLPGGVTQLHDQFGLRNFGTTSYDHLARMHKQRDNPPRRTSLAFMPSPGMDRAFMSSNRAFEEMHAAMPDDTDWFLFEYASVAELTGLLDNIHARWGDRFGQPGGIEEVPVISMLGHGRRSHVSVNERYETKQQKLVSEKLDVDTMRTVIGPRLARLSLPSTTILLDSCEAAAGKQNLADAVVSSTNRRVIAPDGFSVLNDAHFVARPSGDLALRTTFLTLTRIDDIYKKWTEAGVYTYLPYGRQDPPG